MLNIDTEAIATRIDMQAPRSGPLFCAYRWADTLHQIALTDLDDMKKLRIAPYLADAKYRLILQAEQFAAPGSFTN